MTAVPRFLVDPLLVTMPRTHAGTVAMQSFVLALSAWLREVKASAGESWGHFLDCTAALRAAQRFPTFRALRQAVQIAGLDINAEHLARGITDFFENPNYDYFARATIRCVVTDPEARFDPPAMIERNEQDLRSELAATLLCIAADRALGLPNALSCHLVTRSLEGPALSDVRALHITACVALVEPEGVLPKLPSTEIDQRIPLLFSPTDLCELLRPEVILSQGPDAFLQAIRLRAERERADSQPLTAAIGPAFWCSLEESTLCTDLTAMDKLLRVCVNVLLGQASEIKGLNLRPFRQAKDANAGQQHRSRDGAFGWRVTLTKQGIGWRMNYWLAPGPPTRIEFAIVQRKQDSEYIPE